jgi:hypothetical protein
MTTDQKWAAAFNEWLRQYQADPDGFIKTDSEGPILPGVASTYGDRCVSTFRRMGKSLGLSL